MMRISGFSIIAGTSIYQDLSFPVMYSGKHKGNKNEQIATGCY